MPSERRLHPLSIVFNIIRQFGAIAIPLVLVIIGAGSDDDRWSVYGLIWLIPFTGMAVGQYLSFRYRYDESELVVRRGFIFRNQRHIPYERIQNIDAVQNVLHRLTGLVEVRVQTGSGSEPEATLGALTLADLEEMRRRVFGAKGAAAAAGEALAGERPAAAPSRVLLHLPARELVLYGIIENRGLLVIAAAIGLLSEFAAVPRFLERLLGDQANRGFIRRAVRTVFVDGGPSLRVVLYGLAGLVAFLLVSRLFSILWALVRLHGFTLAQAGEDLRAEYGLLTRVTATIPRRRIQTVTIRETPLHRLFGRAAVRVATAGGGAGSRESGRDAGQREFLAPVIRRDDVPALLATLLPGLDVSALDWRRVHPRAFGRIVRRSLFGWAIVAAVAVVLLGQSGVWWWPVFGLWAIVRSRLYVSHLGWTSTASVVAFREGVLTLAVTIVPLAKIQSVVWHESPFDRRTAMARVRVDAAGAGGGGHRVDVPYLPAATAADLYATLGAAASRTAFQW